MQPEEYIVLKDGKTWNWIEDDTLDGVSYGRNKLDNETLAGRLANNVAKKYPTSIISIYKLTSYYKPQDSVLIKNKE